MTFNQPYYTREDIINILNMLQEHGRQSITDNLQFDDSLLTSFLNTIENIKEDFICAIPGKEVYL